MLQMTAQDLRAFETQLEIKAARGNCLARETQANLQSLPNDAARIEYLRGIIEQAQRVVFWAKEFVLKWERKNRRQ